MIGSIVVALLASAPVSGSPALEQQLMKLAPNLSGNVLSLALKAYRKAQEQGHVQKPLLAVIDYSRPSTSKRLWVFDLQDKRVLFHDLVAHGKGSGLDVPTRFSNVPGSLASSVGLFRTADTYQGRHGLSLRLEGLETGINDKAMPRAIVIHAADYVDAGFAKNHGRLGRSWGCPAVSPRIAGRLIDVLREGALVFSFFPDTKWLASSEFLR